MKKVIQSTMPIVLILTLSSTTIGRLTLRRHSFGASATPKQQARQILDTTGIEGGLVIHLGCGDGRGTPPRLGEGRGRSGKIRNADDWPTFRHDSLRSGSTRTPVPTDLGPSWRVAVGGRLSPPVIANGKLFVASIDQHRVAALDAVSGKAIWSFTAGGRVDTPPTIYKGLVLFGSADGWVYCLHQKDGRLAWRRRAAPRERLVGAFGQLESAWPVHGSILVADSAEAAMSAREGGADSAEAAMSAREGGKDDPSTGSEQAVAYLAAGGKHSHYLFCVGDGLGI